MHLQVDEKVAVFGLDLAEPSLVVADQVHLVDEHRELADAEHRHQVAVPPRVLAHAFHGVDHEQGRLGARGAGDQVPDELDVPGGVDEDVVAFRRLEEHARGVDRDALGALVLERVEEERVFEGFGRAAAQLADLIELALRQGVGIGQEPADDRALAVIDVAADHDINPFAPGHRRQSIAGGVGEHLPSMSFSSVPPPINQGAVLRAEDGFVSVKCPQNLREQCLDALWSERLDLLILVAVTRVIQALPSAGFPTEAICSEW